MKNTLTIGLEEHYHATAFPHKGSNKKSHFHLSRVEQNTERILDILVENGCIAIFFIVGSVAARFTGLIQRIVRAGLVTAMSVARYFLSLARSFTKTLVEPSLPFEDAAGIRVMGYRAPSFSITRDAQWAFEVLAELSFSYDSSIYWIKHLTLEQNALRHPFSISTRAARLWNFRWRRFKFLVRELR